ncbi:hypothetical protein T265_01787 [Opisthorchis viverrini]|uniref:EF-hand domain-containing protein n=1 Tax=Opisthorchis viverrini TaxID=6198 RepID=A0A075A1S7_OPIVI|nr:hypothetical protein T265_01787 [Opisthorchis viverrini]KER32177.1 hypothetical protein T265_01787 [Opisthorchis viverrini]
MTTVEDCSTFMHSTVTPFRCLTAMLPEGSTRAKTLPGCPSVDRGSREAEAIPHRANADSLRNVFLKYASVVTNGEHYMTSKDFVIHFLRLIEEQNNNQISVNCLARAADTTKDGLISFDEFLALEALLCTSDALYALAFEIFDSKGRGYLEFEDFKDVFQLTSPYARIPFNFDCDFINLHFGKDRSRKISYQDFTQVIHDIADEHAVQAFKSLDEAHSGTISASDFNKIMILLKGHLLTPFVRENLLTAALQGESHGRITFAYYMGFISLLSNMELVKKIFRNRTHGHQNHELTKEELLTEAQNYAQVTPMEVDILFQLTSLLRPDGRVSYKELVAVSPLEDSLISYHNYAHGLQEAVHRKVEVKGRTMFLSVLEQIYRFSLGSVAGAVGATAVYPIDLVKTRMQNQRTGSLIGELMYKNSWDCFRKVIQFEGFAGLYRGLGPQLIGVAPEKAIKLTVNDLVRDQFTPSSGSIPLTAEILAGACAGASQVVFTNPLEIVKIRLQVAGEIASTKRISAITVSCPVFDLLFYFVSSSTYTTDCKLHCANLLSRWQHRGRVIKDLGFFGLYKGARACFLRDIPFSAIYFTAYSHLKQTFADEKGFNSPATLLAAATLSGAPAACLTTPADVIKTRLQVIKDLGFFGLYKGARACFLRDIPFSAIYFTAYSHLKQTFADEKGFNSPATLLAAATLSGAPAACLTTPADVIKTRLQVEARKGQTTYSGLMDAAKKIWREEGGRAFWKGAGARVFRSSPQFGITLLTYEMLQRVFHIDFGGRELTGTGIDRHMQQTLVNPDHIGGYRFATAAFTGLETKLGLSFPKYTAQRLGLVTPFVVHRFFEQHLRLIRHPNSQASRNQSSTLDAQSVWLFSNVYTLKRTEQQAALSLILGSLDIDVDRSPTDSSSDTIKDTFYDALNALLRRTRSSATVLVAVNPIRTTAKDYLEYMLTGACFHSVLTSEIVEVVCPFGILQQHVGYELKLITLPSVTDDVDQ